MARRQGPQPGGGNNRQGQGRAAQLGTIEVRDFSLGLVRAGSRAGIPESALWNAINVQVIRPGQLQTLVGPGAAVATFGSAVVSLGGVVLNIGGVESTRIITI